jgi:hypothetical protein
VWRRTAFTSGSRDDRPTPALQDRWLLPETLAILLAARHGADQGCHRAAQLPPEGREIARYCAPGTDTVTGACRHLCDFARLARIRPPGSANCSFGSTPLTSEEEIG